MLPESLFPEDARLLLWHPDPGSRRYRTRKTAGRSASWLNTHDGDHACWQYRPSRIAWADGAFRLERRWVGRWDGALSL